ncbi:hypothetical protein D3C86_1395690 [compost metagenome]
MIFTGGAGQPGFRTAIDTFDGEALLSRRGVGTGHADQQLVVLGFEQLPSGAFLHWRDSGAVLEGMVSECFHLIEIIQKHSDLLQVQVLRIAQCPGAKLATELGVDVQAIFENPGALDDAGAYLRQLMLGQQGAPDLFAGLFQLQMEVSPRQVVDSVVVGDGFQSVRCLQVAVIGITVRFVQELHDRDHDLFLLGPGDSAVPLVGFFDGLVLLVEFLEKSFSNRLALGHQFQMGGGIVDRCRVQTGDQLFDPVETFQQSLPGQVDPAVQAVDDNPGAAALLVYDLGAIVAMTQHHLLFKGQVQSLCGFDVVQAGKIDSGAMCRALRG